MGKMKKKALYINNSPKLKNRAPGTFTWHGFIFDAATILALFSISSSNLVYDFETCLSKS